ncbi:MAG: HD domain-containing protein [Sulfurovum sp.]|nr:HD domain-containing protein [Sulfurovum sp.]
MTWFSLRLVGLNSSFFVSHSYKLLPKAQQDGYIIQLWQEFEAGVTADAKYAKI